MYVCKMISATMRDHTHASFLYLHTFLHIIVLSFQRRKEVHHFATVKSRFKNVFVILPAQKKKKDCPGDLSNVHKPATANNLTNHSPNKSAAVGWHLVICYHFMRGYLKVERKEEIRKGGGG